MQELGLNPKDVSSLNKGYKRLFKVLKYFIDHKIQCNQEMFNNLMNAREHAEAIHRTLILFNKLGSYLDQKAIKDLLAQGQYAEKIAKTMPMFYHGMHNNKHGNRNVIFHFEQSKWDAIIKYPESADWVIELLACFKPETRTAENYETLAKLAKVDLQHQIEKKVLKDALEKLNSIKKERVTLTDGVLLTVLGVIGAPVAVGLKVFEDAVLLGAAGIGISLAFPVCLAFAIKDGTTALFFDDVTDTIHSLPSFLLPGIENIESNNKRVEIFGNRLEAILRWNSSEERAAAKGHAKLDQKDFDNLVAALREFAKENNKEIIENKNQFFQQAPEVKEEKEEKTSEIMVDRLAYTQT
ncbi:MAG: hypothetical protein SFW66_07240 [Gammaproteobacteria bacterium]|nr:hypothetical protein [Gammaproteobacteria bacterium]